MGKARKDRRTRYTEEAIKAALLDALVEREFAKVTVADVCARADVHRTTFYLHCSSLDDVLREVIDDMASQIMDSLDQLPECSSVTDSEDGRMSLCQLIRNEERYRPFFLDPTLRECFPKGRPLDDVTDEEVRAVFDTINRRPRKCLEWRTPLEVHYSTVLQLI